MRLDQSWSKTNFSKKRFQKFSVPRNESHESRKGIESQSESHNESQPISKIILLKSQKSHKGSFGTNKKSHSDLLEILPKE